MSHCGVPLLYVRHDAYFQLFVQMSAWPYNAPGTVYRTINKSCIIARKATTWQEYGGLPANGESIDYSCTLLLCPCCCISFFNCLLYNFGPISLLVGNIELSSMNQERHEISMNIMCKLKRPSRNISMIPGEKLYLNSLYFITSLWMHK